MHAPTLTAQSILMQLEEAASRSRYGRVSDDRVHIDYLMHHERRLSDVVRPQVFSFLTFELSEGYRRQGILTRLVKLILEGNRTPRIPMRHLHFQDCNGDIGRVLERLNFHKYHPGPTTDYWHVVTGQKELSL